VVSQEGIEVSNPGVSNSVMARDFWSQPLGSPRLAVFPLVNCSQQQFAGFTSGFGDYLETAHFGRPELLPDTGLKVCTGHVAFSF